MSGLCYIALVDDHVLLRSALAALINSFPGFKVLFEADNGQDFINQLKPRTEPDIVLLDITMPIMNGYETAEWIRVNLPSTRVLVLSMMENDTAIIGMLKLGARGYILKDSKPGAFKEALSLVRNHGFYINDLVSSKMLHYVNHADEKHLLTSCISEREATFLRLACTEKTYKEIADEMFVSPRTIDGYRDSLFEKLGVTSRVGLVIYAIKHGVIAM